MHDKLQMNHKICFNLNSIHCLFKSFNLKCSIIIVCDCDLKSASIAHWLIQISMKLKELLLKYKYVVLCMLGVSIYCVSQHSIKITVSSFNQHKSEATRLMKEQFQIIIYCMGSTPQ